MPGVLLPEAVSTSVTYGNVSFPNSVCSVKVLAVAPPYSTKFIGDICQRDGTTQRAPAGSDPDYGQLYSQNVSVPEGTLLMVQASYTLNGRHCGNFTQFFRVRPDAARVMFRAKMPVYRDSYLGEYETVLSTYADLLTPDEAEGFGLSIPVPARKKWMNMRVEDEFDLIVVKPATVPVVLRLDTEGKTRIAAPTRRIGRKF